MAPLALVGPPALRVGAALRHPLVLLAFVAAAACPERSVADGLETQLLDTVGVEPADASPTDLMQAVSHVARRQLSQRWVKTQAEQRADKARRVLDGAELVDVTAG